MSHQTKIRKKCRFFPGFGLFGCQKSPKIVEKYTTFLQVSWREGPRSGKISPFSGFISTRKPFWNIFFFEPCLENVAKHGGEMVAPNFCQNPTRENAGFFFLKKVLISGEKNAFFQKNTRWGDATLQKWHLIRKVFCGDGAWFAVPYLGGNDLNFSNFLNFPRACPAFFVGSALKTPGNSHSLLNIPGFLRSVKSSSPGSDTF